MLLSGSDTIKGTPTNPGRDLVKIEATDSTGNKATQAFYINTITNTVEPTITSSTVVPTQTPEPTTSVSVFISPTQTESSILNKVALISMFPKDKSTTTSTSITIQAVLNSGFALDKRNVQFFFDNKEYTNQITLITETNSDGSFQTNLSYSTNNLSISSHTVRILVNAPDGTMIPFPWAFSVTKPVVQNPISNIKNSIINALQTRGLWILALLIILILVFIAFIGIIRRGARLSKENSQSNNPDKE